MSEEIKQPVIVQSRYGSRIGCQEHSVEMWFDTYAEMEDWIRKNEPNLMRPPETPPETQMSEEVKQPTLRELMLREADELDRRARNWHSESSAFFQSSVEGFTQMYEDARKLREAAESLALTPDQERILVQMMRKAR